MEAQIPSLAVVWIVALALGFDQCQPRKTNRKSSGSMAILNRTALAERGFPEEDRTTRRGSRRTRILDLGMEKRAELMPGLRHCCYRKKGMTGTEGAPTRDNREEREYHCLKCQTRLTVRYRTGRSSLVFLSG